VKSLHVALALVAAVMAAAAGATDLASPAEPAGARAFIAAPDLADRIMSGDDGLRLFDLRPAAAYQQFHIPTARRVEPADLGAASLTTGADVVLYGDSRSTLSEAVRVLRIRRHAKVLVLREGVSEWLGRVHEPRLAVDATPEERAQFDRAAAMSRFFGGVPLAGVPRSEVPSGYWTGAPRTDELLEAAALQSVALIRRRGC
jgi:rhodanese-related sulfurtransferase